MRALIHSLFPKASPSFGVSNHFLVARRGARLIGFVHLGERPAHVYLQGVGVHPAFRQRGVGRRLLAAALRWAAIRHPARPLKLKVKAANQPAVHLYLREGFSLSRDLGGAYVLSRQENN